MSNGIVDTLVSEFKKQDESPIQSEGEIMLSDWKSTKYKEKYPGMHRTSRSKHQFSEENYKYLERITGLDLDKALTNLGTVLKGKNEKETHRRLKTTLKYIGDIGSEGDAEFMSEENRKNVKDVLYGKHDSYESFKKSLESVFHRTLSSGEVQLTPE
jgi:hypothetical protein